MRGTAAGRPIGHRRGSPGSGPAVGDRYVIRAWLPGRPLTEFGRRRPILPLPLERVKNDVPLSEMTPNTIATQEGTRGARKAVGSETRPYEERGADAGMVEEDEDGRVGDPLPFGRLRAGSTAELAGSRRLLKLVQRLVRNPGGGCPEDPHPDPRPEETVA